MGILTSLSVLYDRFANFSSYLEDGEEVQKDATKAMCKVIITSELKIEKIDFFIIETRFESSVMGWVERTIFINDKPKIKGHEGF